MSRQIERKSANTESLPPELLLEVFAEPIMFHRCYVALTGSVTAALVLSYASYATEEITQEYAWRGMVYEDRGAVAMRHRTHAHRIGNGAAQVEGAGIVGGTPARAAPRAVAVSDQPGRPVRPIARPGAGAVGGSAVTRAAAGHRSVRAVRAGAASVRPCWAGVASRSIRASPISPAVSPPRCCSASACIGREVCTRQQPERDGWFWKTAAEWQRETGLSRREQDSARRILRALGLLEEQRRGMPARRWFRLDLAAFAAAVGPSPRGTLRRLAVG